MRFFDLKSMRLVMLFAAVFLAAGCGVKSSPGVPDGSTYPRIYPYAKNDDKNDDKIDNSVERPASKSSDTHGFPVGGYQPPPPATQQPR